MRLGLGLRLRFNFFLLGRLVPVKDVHGVGVAKRRFQVLSFKLVVKLLESTMAKVADSKAGVAILDDNILKVVNAVPVLPVLFNLNVSLKTHIKVLAYFPAVTIL